MQRIEIVLEQDRLFDNHVTAAVRKTKPHALSIVFLTVPRLGTQITPYRSRRRFRQNGAQANFRYARVAIEDSAIAPNGMPRVGG